MIYWGYIGIISELNIPNLSLVLWHHILMLNSWESIISFQEIQLLWEGKLSGATWAVLLENSEHMSHPEKTYFLFTSICELGFYTGNDKEVCPNCSAFLFGLFLCFYSDSFSRKRQAFGFCFTDLVSLCL